MEREIRRSGCPLHHVMFGPPSCSAPGDTLKGNPVLPGTFLFPGHPAVGEFRGGGHFRVSAGTAILSTAPETRQVDRRAPRRREKGERTGFTAVHGNYRGPVCRRGGNVHEKISLNIILKKITLEKTFFHVKYCPPCATRVEDPDGSSTASSLRDSAIQRILRILLVSHL